MRFYFIIILLLLSTVIQGQETWTLEQCIKHAIENNLLIKQTTFNQFLALKDFKNSKIDFLPSINASASSSYNWGRYFDQNIIQFTTQKTSSSDMSLSSSMDLFGGLNKVNTLRQKKESFNLSASNYLKTIKDISLQIALSYLQILFDMEETANAEKQSSVSKAQLINTEKLVNAGSLPIGDLYNLQAQIAGEELTLVNAQNKLDLDYLSLMQVLDIKSDSKFRIAKPQFESIEIQDYPVNAEVIFNEVKDSLPEIRIAQSNLRIAHLNVRIAQGKLLPTIIGSGSLRSSTSSSLEEDFNKQIDNNRREFIGVSVNIPVFNKNQVQSAVTAAIIEEKNQAINLEIAYNDLAKTIQRAYLEMIASQKKYKAVNAQLNSLNEAFKYAQQKFNVGLINAIEFADTKNKMQKAQSDLLQAKYDYIYKTKVLDFYRGKPLSL